MKRLITYYCIGALLYLCANLGYGQATPQHEESNLSPDIYHVNYWLSGGLVVTGAITGQVGLSRVNNKDGIPSTHLGAIVNRGVSNFDQWSLRQNTKKMREAAETSDKIFYGSIALPALLFLDKKIRHGWYDIALMYGEAQILNSNVYSWSPLGPTFVERYRPAVYYESLPLEERNYGRLRNSFYSGHTATVAVGTFFAAKVFTDYHPSLGGKKYAFYGLALIPPTVVGIYRIKALRHFPTDVVIGGVVGAGIGWLVPELHRKWKNKVSISGTYSSEVKAMGLTYRF